MWARGWFVAYHRDFEERDTGVVEDQFDPFGVAIPAQFSHLRAGPPSTEASKQVVGGRRQCDAGFVWPEVKPLIAVDRLD